MIETRKTEILDEEIESFEEENCYEIQRDELFETLKQIFIQEFHLVEKFHNYCDQYIEYQYDVQGLSDEEADESLRKINILKNKLIEKLQENLDFEIVNIKLLAETYQIKFSCKKNDESFKITFEAKQSSFDLEVL